jgi:hypothetical protein
MSSVFSIRIKKRRRTDLPTGLKLIVNNLLNRMSKLIAFQEEFLQAKMTAICEIVQSRATYSTRCPLSLITSFC